MKNSVAALLLLLVVIAASCNNNANKGRDVDPKKEADSLLEFMKVDVNEAFNREPVQQALYMLDSITPIAEANGDAMLINNLLRFKGTYYSNRDQYDSAKKYILLALTHAEQTDTSRKQVYASKMMLANIFKKEMKLDTALLYAREAYAFSKENDTAIYPVTCLRLAEIYTAIGDVEMNGKYLLEGFEHATNKRLRRVIASNISRYYDNIKQYDSALIFFQRNVLPDTALFGPSNYGDILQNYGVLLQKKGNMAQAIQMYERALNHYRNHDGDKQSFSLLYFNIADGYRKMKDYKQSNIFLDSSIANMAQPINLDDLSNSLKNKSSNYFHLGDYKNAYLLKDSAFMVYENYVDSSFMVQARELETQYQVKAKDNEIQALNAANESVRKISALQQILLVVSGIILILLIAFAILIYRRRGLKERLKQTELEQQLLRSQMEPHFIFNTLSTLQSLIRNDERGKSVKYLNQFARLLRLNLENSRASFVLLTREVEALQNYLSLQLMRFETVFEYQLEVYEDYEDDEVYIPPMLIQPFVENAIQYGVQNLDAKGLLRIAIQKQENIIKCTIEDNGKGLQQDKIAVGKQSLSTEIIKERLEILSRKTGTKASLSVVDKASVGRGQGVIVELCIPYKTSAE